MARLTFTLTGDAQNRARRVRWNDPEGGAADVSALLAAGASATITRLQIIGDQRRIRLYLSNADAEFTAAWRQAARAIQLSGATIGDLDIPGPNAPAGVSSVSSGQRYEWVITANTQPWVVAYEAQRAADASYSVTLALFDGAWPIGAGLDTAAAGAAAVTLTKQAAVPPEPALESVAASLTAATAGTIAAAVTTRETAGKAVAATLDVGTAGSVDAALSVLLTGAQPVAAALVTASAGAVTAGVTIVAVGAQPVAAVLVIAVAGDVTAGVDKIFVLSQDAIERARPLPAANSRTAARHGVYRARVYGGRRIATGGKR